MIYLDYAATTPVDQRVVDAMLPLFTESFANAASKHSAGQSAAWVVERARREVADLLGTHRKNLIFTSGATESAVTAIRGVIAGAATQRRRIIVSATEHRAVLAAAETAGRDYGSVVDLVRVNGDGTVDLTHLADLIADDVALVAVMAANNETGVINDIPAIAALAHSGGALMLCDITQAAGRVRVRLDDWGVDLAIASAHKLYGPKGVGVLSVSRTLRRRLVPLVAGGGQEHGLRGGTANVPGIVGFGRAAVLAAAELEPESRRQQELLRLLLAELREHLAVDVVAQGAPRVPGTLCVRLPGIDADALLSCLPEVMISSGAACSSTRDEPSHVLLAMGMSPHAARQTLRFSVGRPTTVDQIRSAAQLVAKAAEHVRALAAASPRKAQI